MRNNPIFKDIQKLVRDNSYTIEQIENATEYQLKNLLNVDSLGSLNFSAMKQLLIRDLEDTQAEEDMQHLLLEAKNWLNMNFPEWDAVRGTEEDNKRFVKIWLYGKPEEL